MIDLRHSVLVSRGEPSAPRNPGRDVAVACATEGDVLPAKGPGRALVKNGGFEGDVREDWKPYVGGYSVSRRFKRSGLQSVRVTNGGAWQRVPLDAGPGSRVTIRGYGKAVGTSRGLWDHGLYADVSYADGGDLWGQIAIFPGGTHGFTRGEKTFVVPRGRRVTGMTLYALYRNDPIDGGVAYFDDVEVVVE